MRDIKFFNDFLVHFKQTIKNQNQRALIIYYFDWNQTLSSVMRVIGGILVLFNVYKLHSSYIRPEIIR